MAYLPGLDHGRAQGGDSNSHHLGDGRYWCHSVLLTSILAEMIPLLATECRGGKGRSLALSLQTSSGADQTDVGPTARSRSPER
jgi:hypothetical protein